MQRERPFQAYYCAAMFVGFNSILIHPGNNNEIDALRFYHICVIIMPNGYYDGNRSIYFLRSIINQVTDIITDCNSGFCF